VEVHQYPSFGFLLIDICLYSYQFNPALAKEPVIVKILVKALTAIPAPDFNLCLYLLAEHAVSLFLYVPAMPPFTLC
jgi:hypothetical protein